MTDFHFWSTLLTEKEMMDITNCDQNPSGDIIDWETAEFELSSDVNMVMKSNQKVIFLINLLIFFSHSCLDRELAELNRVLISYSKNLWHLKNLKLCVKPLVGKSLLQNL